METTSRPRSLAAAPSKSDQRFEASHRIRERFEALGSFEGLAELMEKKGQQLAEYANELLQVRALYNAPARWLGPLGLVLNDEDFDAMADRVDAYEADLRRKLWKDGT
mgnify:CR=1 FL=1